VSISRLPKETAKLITSEFDNCPLDEVRDASEIARRALALFGVAGLGLGALHNDINSWLKEEDLWDELSPSELAYVSENEPTEKQSIDATWKSEALIVLLWSLEKMEYLPAITEQCDTSIFQELLPPYANLSSAEFIASAKRRPDDILIKMADELMGYHWQARDARIHSKPTHLDIEIIQERHHAINWVIGYDGAPWDEVTTDT
jgi:hypothetical protein